LRIHTLHRELIVPFPAAKVFQFFCDPQNLKDITPPWLHFQTCPESPSEMKRGVLLGHRFRIYGVPIYWQSEITVWEPPLKFVDEQRKGPYRRWTHEHIFEQINSGTRCIDHVRYAVWGGSLIQRWIIGPDLERIFNYRQSRFPELLASS